MDAESPPPLYGPEQARADAAERGYHTPGTLRVLLGLRRWELDEGLAEGVLPEPDRTSGRHQRWSVEAAEAMLAQDVAREVRASRPHSAPMGSVKAAGYIGGWRDGFKREDLHSLVELGLLAPCGEYLGNPLFDVRDLDALTHDDADKAVARTARRSREGVLMPAAQCARRLRIRLSDWQHVVALGWVRPVEVVPGRYKGQRVRLYRLTDLDDLLLREGVDWEAVRSTPKGGRSPLLDAAAAEEAEQAPAPLRTDLLGERDLARMLSG